MPRVRVHNLAVSLDGFSTGEGQSLEQPFGHAAVRSTTVRADVIGHVDGISTGHRGARREQHSDDARAGQPASTIHQATLGGSCADEAIVNAPLAPEVDPAHIFGIEQIIPPGRWSPRRGIVACQRQPGR